MPSADKHAGVPRHHDRIDLERPGDLARVHAAGAAERDEREPARIVPALDGHDANRALHVRVGDADDAFRQLADAEFQPLRQIARHRFGSRQIERHAAAEEQTPDRAGPAAGWRQSPSVPRPRRSTPGRAPSRRIADRRAARRRSRRTRSNPPPAPTVWMSMTGSRTGKSPIRDSVDVGIAPSTRLTSVDVPPMSNEMMRSEPLRRARRPARRPRRPRDPRARCEQPAHARARRKSSRRSTA